jgi:predicted Zn-dependent protease
MKVYTLLLLLIVTPLLASTPSSAQAPSPAQTDQKKVVRNGNAKSLELNEAGAKAVQAQKFVEGELLFKRALDIDPTNLTAVTNLALTYLQNRKTQQAVDLLIQYIPRSPDDVGLIVRLGDAYFAQKKIQKAKDTYLIGYKKAPRFPGLAAKLGSISVASRDLKGAEKYLTEAVALEPKNSTLVANLSSLLLANGKPKDAVAYAKRGVQIASSAEMYSILGSGYELLKDPQNALIAYRRAKDLGDSTKELQTKINALESISQGG